VALSLTQDLGKEDLSPVARTRLDSLAMALDQMRRQSADLLDLERFQLGVARLDPLELDTCTWLARFEEGLTSLARTRRLTFQVVHHDHDLRARFDPVRMETVLHNLVGNALKFTPQGGHIEVHVAREADRTLVLSVIDDGEGIPAAALPTIFDRYQQVDRGPGTYTVGAGIGLALVREIVEAHQGSIRVESTPGLGSLFEIRLPGALSHDHNPLDTSKQIPLPPPPPPPVLPNPVRPPRGAILALVVEDDMLLRHVLVDLLAGVARCATARDGREALRLAVELQPDIVITDLVMPTMDGMSLLAAIRQDPVIANTPVILLTGDPQTLADRLAPDSRLAIHGKPFNRSDLVETILDLAHPGLGAETDLETNS
jgi:CheY-like chemotaxis protein